MLVLSWQTEEGRLFCWHEISLKKKWKSNIENNNIQIAAYAKNWQYGNGGKVKVFYSKIKSNENKFYTSSDPDDSDKSYNKNLIQNSEIEIISSSISGKINVKGKNFSYNKW